MSLKNGEINLIDNEKIENNPILTIRVPKELKSKLEDVSRVNLNSKISRTAQNYLKLCEIMIIREDSMKVSWDNSKLIIFHEEFIKDLINLINSKLNDTEKFTIWADLGDKTGKYLNDVLSISNIKSDDYLKIMQIIKAMGWFDYSINIYDDANDIVLIPKSFMNKPFVYAFVYRLLQKTHYPNEWNMNLLEGYMKPNPHDPKKDKDNFKRYQDQLDQYYNNYNNTVQKVLQIDEEKQRDSNFYYFKRLKVPKKIAVKPAEIQQSVNPTSASDIQSQPESPTQPK